MPKCAPQEKKKLETGGSTTEADAFLNGLYQEFHEQLHKYNTLTSHLMSLEARIELSEKTLCLTRDHLMMAIKRSDSTTPREWDKTLATARFVGWRLVDACLELLREHKKLRPEELRDQLNIGMFRFRTSAPLREIHAALLRQSAIKKENGAWIYAGEQEPMRLRVVSSADDQKAE
jgi:hypothetical protein